MSYEMKEFIFVLGIVIFLEIVMGYTFWRAWT